MAADPPGPPEIVDAHFHVWGEPFPARPFPYTPDPWPAERMVDVFDAHGVGRGIDVTPIMYGWDNSYALDASRRTRGRLRVAGRFDALAPDPEPRLRAWLSQPGAAGVRLTFYGAGLRDLDAPERLDPFWRAAEALGVRVSVFAPDRLDEIVRAIERHPRLKLVVDHLGLGVYPGCPDPFANQALLAEFAAFPQVLVKISGLVEVSREPFPFRDVHGVLADAHARFGAERLLWGSNHPVVTHACDYGEALRFVDHCEVLTDADRAAVMGRNAARMLAEDAA